MSDDHQPPSTPVGNGRTSRGTFAPGNRLAKGNPNNARAQRIRNAIIRAVTPKDMAEAARKLVEDAKTGDRQAFAELCDRIIGRPSPADIEERLARLEQLLQERNSNGRN